MRKFIFPLVASVVLAAPALAHEVEEEEDTGPWYGKVAFGYLAASGNTENANLNSGLEVGYATGQWDHFFNARAIFASEENVTTTEAYEWGWKSELSFSEYNYLFGRLSWRKDRFSTYESQFSQTAGYGRRLLNSERQHLDVEIGGGARQSELIDGSSENEFVVRGGLRYRLAIGENAEFRQELSVESGQENTYLESKTGLSASLIGNLALVASYTIKNNSDVIAPTEKTDTYTAISLEYLF
jgi:putative salt-induced outer membrane protein